MLCWVFAEPHVLDASNQRIDDPDDRNVCRSHRRRTGGHARNIGMSKLVGSRAELYVMPRKRLCDGVGHRDLVRQHSLILTLRAIRDRENETAKLIGERRRIMGGQYVEDLPSPVTQPARRISSIRGPAKQVLVD